MRKMHIVLLILVAIVGYAMYEMAWKTLEKQVDLIVDRVDKLKKTVRQIDRRDERQRALDRLDDHQQ